MKTFLLLAAFLSQFSLAASADNQTFTGSKAEAIFTNLVVERSLDGDKSRIEEYMSASTGKPGEPNTQVYSLVKAGAEATLSCTQSTTYSGKVSTLCDISPTDK